MYFCGVLKYYNFKMNKLSASYNLKYTYRYILLFLVVFSLLTYLFYKYESHSLKEDRKTMEEMIDSFFEENDQETSNYSESKMIKGFFPDKISDLHFSRLIANTQDPDDGFNTGEYMGIDDTITYIERTGQTVTWIKPRRKKEKHLFFDFNDSLLFTRRYGTYDHFSIFPHTNSSWKIVVFRLKEKGIIECDTIIPKLIGYNGEIDTVNVVQEIKVRLSTRFNTNQENSYRFISLDGLKTKYHYINKVKYKESYHDEGIVKSVNSNKYLVNYRVKPSFLYMMEIDYEKFYGFFIICVLLSAIIAASLSIYLYINKKKRYLSKIEEIVASPQIDYDCLLDFLSSDSLTVSYSKEKLKIAKQLYDILLKSERDESIVKMVYEKAKAELEFE